MARIALVGPDLVVTNVLRAEFGYEAPAGLFAVPSADANPGDTFNPVNGTFSRPVVTVTRRKSDLVAEVKARRSRVLAEGMPFRGKRIDVDGAARSDLNTMLITALLVETGAMHEWPEEYILGWICTDNSRLSLATAQDGIELGVAVTRWTVGLTQIARVAKDAILAAEDPDAAAEVVDWSPWEPAKRGSSEPAKPEKPEKPEKPGKP
jgi:hypothetical protein